MAELDVFVGDGGVGLSDAVPVVCLNRYRSRLQPVGWQGVSHLGVSDGGKRWGFRIADFGIGIFILPRWARCSFSQLPRLRPGERLTVIYPCIRRTHAKDADLVP